MNLILGLVILFFVLLGETGSGVWSAYAALLTGGMVWMAEAYLQVLPYPTSLGAAGAAYLFTPLVERRMLL